MRCHGIFRAHFAPLPQFYSISYKKNRSIRHSGTIEFRHECITVSAVTPEDKVVNAITKLKQKFTAIPSPTSLNQLTKIEKLQTTFSKCKNNEPSTTIDQHHDTAESNQLPS